MTTEGIPQRQAAELQLALFAGGELEGRLLEARVRAPGGGMRPIFYPAREYRRAAADLQQLGQCEDVFVGVAPRRAGVLNGNGRQSGGLDAIRATWTLHVDADTEAACAALATFEPAAAVIVRSGTGAHGYWPLRAALEPRHAARANRRLALALGGDLTAADAARILRPAGTQNFKTDPPRPVTCTRLEVVSYTVREVVGHLPDPPESVRQAPAPDSRPLSADDPLRRIPASEYVPALTGRPVGRDGKARCPFHAGGEERTASLHAYPGDGGWHCFGCDRGGTIIDLGALLYGLEPRGAGFHEIRRRLAADLLTVAAA